MLQARSLVKTKVTEELKREVKKNQASIGASLNLEPTESALFLNGMFFDPEIVDIFTLLETIKDEQRVMQGLHKLGKLHI